MEKNIISKIPIRPVPFPYHAMLAICSDLDETPDFKTYRNIMEYLNSNKETPLGKGLGLEIANTIYFDMPADQFSYWGTSDEGRSFVRTLIKSGHIDSLHSFGDLTTYRDQAKKNLAELVKYDCRLKVWIDHGRAPSNLCPDIMKGKGDLVNSYIYHTDLTLSYGIKYIWRGRVTSIVGQNVPVNYSGILNKQHFAMSVKTLAKEFAKISISSFVNSKYSLHKKNQIIDSILLRDGQKVYEFLRCNPHFGGVSCGDTADGIAEVLNIRLLDTLIKRRGACILYTHLGKSKNKREIFSSLTKEAFRLLAKYAEEKKILVTTTHRLLHYLRELKELDSSQISNHGRKIINITVHGDMKQIEGLTVYTPDPSNTILKINGRVIDNIISNMPDETGQASVSLPWSRLEYPHM